MDGRPTLETVARHAQVSRQTVSNVLNAPHVVRAETREKVEAAIAELGYKPHGAARQLRTQRSRVIGMRIQHVHDGINGAVLDRFLHALTEQAQMRGYRLMLFSAADADAEIAQYAELLDVLQLDAFVLTSTHAGDPRTAYLTANDVPFVTFGRPWDPPDSPAPQPDHSWVDVDGSAGTRAAVEHLQQLGHSEIAWIGWPPGSEVGDDRRSGWLRAMRASGVGQHRIDALETGAPDGVREGARAAEALRRAVAPTAFVCASDSLALGALQVADRSAVVGFDDTPVARAVGMSSIAQPLTEAAGRGVDLLLDQLSGKSHEPEHVLLVPNLVARDSSNRQPVQPHDST